MIFGDHCPSIRQQPGLGSTGVNHWLYRKRHSGPDLQALTDGSVVQDLWVFMKTPADAVATILSHHRKSSGLGMLLYCRTDIAQATPRSNRRDSFFQTFLACLNQAAAEDRRLAYGEHPARVAVEPILNYSDIDMNNIAVF
jgi:hypothetical protein